MKSFLIRLKYRYDIGISVLQIATFCMTVIAASDSLKELFQISTKLWLLILVPASLLCVIVLGYILDRVKFIEHWNREANKRNELFVKLEKQEKILREIQAALANPKEWV